MRRVHWIGSALLLILLLAVSGGLFWTRSSGPPAGLVARLRGRTASGKAKPVVKERTVETRYLLATRQLGSQAGTPEEQELARQAERLANHELTLSFNMAMRRTAEAPVGMSAEMKEQTALVDKAEDAVEADQRSIRNLESQLAHALETRRDDLNDQLEVARAQLELDQDELDSAREDLDRMGGDSKARIKRLKEAYDAMEREPSTLGQAASALAAQTAGGGLLERIRTWRFQAAKRRQLAQAQDEIRARIQKMGERRDKLAQQIKDEAAQKAQARHEARDFAKGGTQYEGTTSEEEKKAALESLRAFVARQQRYTSFTKRLEDFQALDEVYGSWRQLADTQARTALHELLKVLLRLLLIVLGIFVLHRALERILHTLSREKLRAATLQSFLKLVILVIGLVAILLTVTGIPKQLATFLGIIGAALTLALRNFIVAFFGWFVLVGRNGVRVGDWVEINGVGGEVVELGLMRTIIMETGSWNELGHPTGRKVSFINSYAVEHHFFNFSTAGQWMWDELQLVIPPGTDPYPIIDGIQKLVTERTEASAREAEAEWRKATTRYRVRTFSTVPGIHVIPGALGIEVRVRYITRAFDRNSTRKALYEAILDLMQGKLQAWHPPTGNSGAL
nr:mechanosensitive ion channel domain-containing protein [uncultured Holophaga sp.]